eukprot:CAMPEP_0197623860 /NCGR_PEP_ID=MMETSP1338-20131121/3760_1 /TAXON_ID=43686 ORGANISM="Pelagodinium beii, Strain RCC1491" /NCGR_SAMPLE_ID=MMETSP1338 /ASSEMBLY_ACC=CAM_ASM_000754 /LENGTH=379 /DNA_ID=CAMNT_0043193945 /DNA_START=234 /DNA_END=1373 /DNA_ORIENTATION=+
MRATVIILAASAMQSARSMATAADDYVSLCSAPAEESSKEPTGTAPAGPAVAGHPDPVKLYPEYTGFTLSLVEEFNEAIDLDTDPIWTWSDGGLSEGQVRFVKEQIQFKDGKMTITAAEDPGIATQTCSAAEVGKVDKKPLVSGEFRARHNQFRYGRYEVRMKAPEVKAGNPDVDGNFISTMFVYRDAKFNHWREIDIEVTGDSPHTVTTNVLSADHTDKWSTKIAAGRQVHIDGNARATFHTYAFEWLPNSITWYIDGKKVRTKTPAEHPPIPDLSGKIMMNLWIFGKTAGFGGKEIYNNRYPMSNEYDWFRFYKWDGEETYPCAGMSTSCLTADDEFLSKNNPCDGQEQKGLLHGKMPSRPPADEFKNLEDTRRSPD